MSGCGCNKQEDDSDSDYVLLKSTTKNAARCLGDIDDTVLGADCAKKDRTYDLLLAEFSFPDTDSLQILVCNGSLYSVGQWIQFVGTNGTVNIISINGNQLTVRARCVNNATIEGNPTAGTIIRRNTSVIPVDAPACLPDSQKQKAIENALANAESLELPNLSEGISSDYMQAVGRVESNTEETGFKKALKRIKGIFAKNGTPILTELTTATLAQSLQLRNLAIDKITHEVKEKLNLSEDPSLEAGKKYIYGVSNGAEKLIPGKIFSPIFLLLEKRNGSPTNFQSWTNLSNGASDTRVLQFNIEEINDLEILGDVFYAQIRIRSGCYNPSGQAAGYNIEIDGTNVGGGYIYFNNIDYQTYTITVPVSNITKTASMKIGVYNAGYAGYYMEAFLEGVLI